MGQEKPFEPWKLIIGLLIAEEDPPESDEIVSSLEARFGPADFTSGPAPFTFTDYYNKEMGSRITRKFVSFERLVNPGKLSDIKRITDAIEIRFSRSGRRRVNIDPGILSLSRLILASTKDNAHRVPLSKGIYGEITLLYRGKGFVSLPWTYPDYDTDLYKDIFIHIRKLLREQLKHGEASFSI